ncbi:glycosyltransferase family 2 protein [Sphingosinicellaceae bacterium]|nr:glycosyltransferase family 2 protein [Sphingosinicellaceae bacterium]
MWLARDHPTLPNLPAGQRRPVAVGVPAHNEAGQIASCLAALDLATQRAGVPVTVIVGANNCVDDTAERARAFASRAAQVLVAEIVLPAERAHAGGARRHVMDLAADCAGPGGVVMTTDADSAVDVDWIVANLGEIASGADAVAGVITFDAAARQTLPDLGHRAGEWRLAALHARLEDLIDPRAHDPWPRHIWAWGASLALTVETYRAVGGVPVVALAEDRALADAVDRAGLRLRRSHAPLVYTSARHIGRAPGGFADLLASHASTTSPCDAALEPTRVLLRRLVLRAQLRLEAGARFPVLWATVEATTPRLKRRRLLPADLAREVWQAERVIAALERRARHRGDSPAVALAA